MEKQSLLGPLVGVVVALSWEAKRQAEEAKAQHQQMLSAKEAQPPSNFPVSVR